MKKIGTSVNFISVGENRPRIGEGTLIRLKNGDIMYVLTEYIGAERADHSNAHLSVCLSRDGGESWSDPICIIEKDGNAENIMSPSLIRLKNGDLGMIYLRKEKKEDGGMVCMPTFVSSRDEGKSWSKPHICEIDDGYYCAINDGAVVLKSGRILVPMSYYGLRFDAYGICTLDLGEKKGGEIVFAYSDDNGESWNMLPYRIKSPYGDTTGLAEPGVYEYEDGELWMWCRTSYGFQYESRSKDGGNTWSAVKPNMIFTSPDAPMRVKKVGKYTVAVYNPIPHNYFSHSKEDWGAPKRTPLVIAVCNNDGRSFVLPGIKSVNRELDDIVGKLYYIEDDTHESYCYPAIIDTDDGFIVGYYHSGGTGHCLTCNKITKIYYSELENN